MEQKHKYLAIAITVGLATIGGWYSSGEYERFVKEKAERLSVAIDKKNSMDLESESLMSKSKHLKLCSSKYDEYLTKLLAATGGTLPDYPDCERLSPLPKANASELAPSMGASEREPHQEATSEVPDPKGLNESTKDLKESALLKPDELIYSQKVSDKCYVSQTEESHFMKKNGYVLATDVACNF